MSKYLINFSLSLVPTHRSGRRKGPPRKCDVRHTWEPAAGIEWLLLLAACVMPSHLIAKRGALRVSVLVLRVFVSVSRKHTPVPQCASFMAQGKALVLLRLRSSVCHFFGTEESLRSCCRA